MARLLPPESVLMNVVSQDLHISMATLECWRPPEKECTGVPAAPCRSSLVRPEQPASPLIPSA
ncbi:MAG: hypothetical protein D8H96_06960 [Lautropia sp.]|nr:MAG: hypothetical protein D8H96_06960 [Lautropia sp.]